MPLHTETKKLDNSKKTQTLALFGKRGTFKYSTVPVQPKLATPIPLTHGNKSDEEEVEEKEENDENEEKDEKESIETDILPSSDKKALDDEQTNKPSTSARLIRNPPKAVEKHQEPEKEVATDRTLVVDGEDDDKHIITNGSNSSSHSSSSSSNATKKKRNRIRIRNDKGRENVDFDEEMVDTEKYSTWVPPQGQSGDGSTDLNEKYGY